MTDILLIGLTWVHLLCTVIMIGLYMIMFLAVTPAFIQGDHSAASAGIIVDAYKRGKPLVLLAWLVFILTGIYLLLIDDQYNGIGQFNNPWSVIMLIKHVLILGMILLSGFIHACPVIGLMRPLESALRNTDGERIQTLIATLHSRERIMVLLGLVVLLLTVAAQAARGGI